MKSGVGGSLLFERRKHTVRQQGETNQYRPESTKRGAFAEIINLYFSKDFV